MHDKSHIQKLGDRLGIDYGRLNQADMVDTIAAAALAELAEHKGVKVNLVIAAVLMGFILAVVIVADGAFDSGSELTQVAIAEMCDEDGTMTLDGSVYVCNEIKTVQGLEAARAAYLENCAGFLKRWGP